MSKMNDRQVTLSQDSIIWLLMQIDNPGNGLLDYGGNTSMGGIIYHSHDAIDIRSDTIKALKAGLTDGHNRKLYRSKTWVVDTCEKCHQITGGRWVDEAQ